MPNYTPGIVPDEPKNLKSFLQSELERISLTFINLTRAAFGGMVSNDQVPLSLTAAPQPLAVFTSPTPARSWFVVQDLAAASLTVESGGAYVASFQGTLSEIGNGVQVFIEFLVNGAQARTLVVDPSNQTAFTATAFGTMIELKRGDTVTANVYASGPDSVVFEDCSFFLFRVSDTYD